MWKKLLLYLPGDNIIKLMCIINELREEISREKQLAEKDSQEYPQSYLKMLFSNIELHDVHWRY